MARLAAADAFRSMGLSRREALWEVLGLDDDPLPLFAEMEPDEERPQLTEMSVEERMVQDYDMVGLSLETHPLALVRPQLDGLRVTPASALRDAAQGRRVQVAGLVLVRQRPGTASGIVFMTLEDETGVANLIVRPRVFERDRATAAGAVAILVDGVVERQGEVIHVQVSRVRDLSKALPGLRPRSRDFH